MTNNAFRIDMGAFKTDPNRSFWGRTWQLISRFTWEYGQNELGQLYSHIRNITGGIDDVSYYGGATLVNRNNINDRTEWGLTLGSYINSQNLVADPDRNEMFRHEYGHVLQSVMAGPFYINNVGLPSLIGSGISGDHDSEWYETGANRMALRYLRKKDSESLITLPWNTTDYLTRYRPFWYWVISAPSNPFVLFF